MIKGLACAELSVHADHAGLDRTAILQQDGAGNDAGMRKVHLVDTPTSFRDDLTLLEMHDREMRRELRQKLRLEFVQEPIFSMRHRAVLSPSRRERDRSLSHQRLWTSPRPVIP